MIENTVRSLTELRSNKCTGILKFFMFPSCIMTEITGSVTSTVNLYSPLKSTVIKFYVQVNCFCFKVRIMAERTGSVSCTLNLSSLKENPMASDTDQ